MNKKNKTKKGDSIPVEKRVSPMLAEWISVKVLLPKEKEKVLVFVKHLNGNTKIDFSYLRTGENYFDCFNTDSITHWMPLPEPPKQ